MRYAPLSNNTSAILHDFNLFDQPSWTGTQFVHEAAAPAVPSVSSSLHDSLLTPLIGYVDHFTHLNEGCPGVGDSVSHVLFLTSSLGFLLALPLTLFAQDVEWRRSDFSETKEVSPTPTDHHPPRPRGIVLQFPERRNVADKPGDKTS